MPRQRLVEQVWGVAGVRPSREGTVEVIAQRYGEEIGMGEDLSLNGREAIRTPMQWDDTSNADSWARTGTVRLVGQAAEVALDVLTHSAAQLILVSPVDVERRMRAGGTHRLNGCVAPSAAPDHGRGATYSPATLSRPVAVARLTTPMLDTVCRHTDAGSRHDPARRAEMGETISR